MNGMNSGAIPYREDAVIRQDVAENRARQSAAAAVDPTGALLVTHGHERLCINCRWCTDWDEPTPPAFLACTRPIISAAAKGTPPCCVTARSTHFGHLACGHDGEWFIDALEPDWHRDCGPE